VNSSEETLKMQRALSDWNGSRKIAFWLSAIACVCCLGELIFDASSRDHLFRTIGSWLSIVSIALLNDSTARQKIHELKDQLHARDKA
jgi:hypothetical protein